MNKTLLVFRTCVLAITIGLGNYALAAPILWVDDSSGNLGTVDVATGTVNVIGNMGHVMFDIAFDPSGNLYGITSSALYSINSTTAASTFIGNLGTGSFTNSLVFDSSGTLYTANSSLYTVNATSGAATLVGNGGAPYFSSGDLAFIGGELFLSSAPGDNLVKLNTSTGVGTLIGGIGFSSVFGLATDNNIDLYGLTGTSVLSINTTTGTGTALVNYGGQGLGAANGTAFFAEACTTCNSVPEPTTFLLLGSGLAGIVVLKRRLTA